jgi:beta-1,4-mannosyltransferase
MKNTAAILVLGDLNRSPRMLNHSKAISDVMSEINEVSLIGYQGSDLRSDIKNDSKIKVYYISENNPLRRLPRFMFILAAVVKIFLQILHLFYILLTIPRYKFLILQNPPGIPAMYICAVVCFLRRAKFIIDWHNYGYTILQCNNRNRIICLIAKAYEYLYAHSSHLNFCVSDAMREHLSTTIGINAIVLPDQAMMNIFRRLDIEESHNLFQKYNEYV